METIIQSFFLVFAGEMGDKTQLLTLVLITRFHKPLAIMAGILVATLLNHAIAAWFGNALADFFEPEKLKLILGISFFVFAIWVLIPDKNEDFKSDCCKTAFVTSAILFFIAEIGDKTQIATIALGAKFPSILAVTIGTTLGMLTANALAVVFGKKLLKIIPMKWVRTFTCMLFAIFGLVTILY